MWGRLSIFAAPLIALVLISVALYAVSLILDGVQFVIWLWKQNRGGLK